MGSELSLDANSKRKNLSSTDSFGKPEEICCYIDGKENGEYKKYDENGELIEKCYYDNGIKVE